MSAGVYGYAELGGTAAGEALPDPGTVGAGVEAVVVSITVSPGP